MFNLNWSITTLKLIPFSRKVYEKMQPSGFAPLILQPPLKETLTESDIK